ncbi:hypothetical protein [Fictibacillus fluitans]|uniref:Uncharacterized protein n=1 Tax=Fictibacillus fluitans TaxID=3058422 RepID=A0ABT8HV41_9BACL|nr:hypothetical protein [Fictibacillus sp. NE201]MDN4524616.1 hypothetical protein [Fictibacillus sp. NE201]
MEELKGLRNQLKTTVFNDHQFDESNRKAVHQRYRSMETENRTKRKRPLVMTAASLAVCALLFFLSTSLVTNHGKLDPASGRTITKTEMKQQQVVKEATKKGEVVSYLNEKWIPDSKTKNLEYMLRLKKEAEQGMPFKTSIHYFLGDKIYENTLEYNGKQIIYKNTVPSLGERKTYKCKAFSGSTIQLEGCTGVKEGYDVLVVPVTLSDMRYAEAKQ